MFDFPIWEPDEIAENKKLLNTYRKMCDGDWTELASSKGIRERLAPVLAAAGEFETLYHLVAGSDAWAKARFANEGHYRGYLADLRLAWDRVQRDEGWDVGRQIRCALIESSVHSKYGSLWGQVLVTEGVWTPREAFDHVSQLTFLYEAALRDLVPYLPPDLQLQVLSLAPGIDNPHARFNLFHVLAANLKGKPQSRAAQGAIEAARALRHEGAQGRALVALSEHVPPSLYPAIMQAVEELDCSLLARGTVTPAIEAGKGISMMQGTTLVGISNGETLVQRFDLAPVGD